MKGKKVFRFYLKRHRSFCSALQCAFDGDILVVKQRDVFYNALTQTFLLQIYNNAFIVSGEIDLFREDENSSIINVSKNQVVLTAYLVFVPSLIEIIQIT